MTLIGTQGMESCMTPEGLCDRFFLAMLDRWWTGLVAGILLIAAGWYIYHGLPLEAANREEANELERMTIISGSLAMCGVCLSLIGFVNRETLKGAETKRSA